MRKTIAFDFDGVLHSYVSGWNGPIPKDPPVDGARSFLWYLVQDGRFDVVIFSTRAAEPAGFEGIRDWLRKHKFPQVRITAIKPPAIVYIDDRAWRFQGPHSFDDLKERLMFDLQAFRPWIDE